MMQRINQSFRFERWAGLDLIACACNPQLGVSCAAHYMRVVRAAPFDTEGLGFRERRAMRDAYVAPTCDARTYCPIVALDLDTSPSECEGCYMHAACVGGLCADCTQERDDAFRAYEISTVMSGGQVMSPADFFGDDA
jgi:hypothetical protein